MMAQSGPYGMMSNMSDLGGIQRLMELMGGTTDRSMEYGQDFGQPERMASLVGSLEDDPYQVSLNFGQQASGQQDFTQVVPIAGAQNVGVQRGNPLQTLLSIIQRRRQGLQGRQGQQGLLQSGFTGRV
jgi:hypothetical protein